MYKTTRNSYQKEFLTMTQTELVKGLAGLVDIHGAARVAVELSYRSDRSICNWISNRNIPRARRKMVENLLKKGIKSHVA